MHPSWALVAALVAGALPLGGRDAEAGGMAEVFARGARIDLALEIDYRSRFFTADDLTHDELPPDRVSRERIDDGRVLVEREYRRRLLDAMRDQVVRDSSVVRDAMEQYDDLLTIHLFRERAAAPHASLSGSAPAPGGGPADGDVPWWRPAPTTLRFRPGNGVNHIAPAIELIQGAFHAQLRYRPSRERLDLTVSRPLFGPLDFDAAVIQTFGQGGLEYRVGLHLLF